MSGLVTVLLAKALFFGPLAVAAAMDLWDLRIPNPVSATLALLFPVAAALTGTPVDWIVHVGLAAGILALGFALFARGVLGGGDVKLLAALTLWYGVDRLLPMLVVMALCGALFGCIILSVRAVRRRVCVPSFGVLDHICEWQGVPYGVAIALGAMLVKPMVLMGN